MLLCLPLDYARVYYYIIIIIVIMYLAMLYRLYLLMQ